MVDGTEQQNDFAEDDPIEVLKDEIYDFKDEIGNLKDRIDEIAAWLEREIFGLPPGSMVSKKIRWLIEAIRHADALP